MMLCNMELELSFLFIKYLCCPNILTWIPIAYIGMEILLFRRAQSPDQHSHHPVASIRHFTFLKAIFTNLQISFQLYGL